MPGPARGQGAVAVLNDSFIAIGGYTGLNALSTVTAFGFSTYTWAASTSLPAVRYAGNGAVVISSEIYVAGGWTQVPALPNSNLWRLSPGSSTWTTLANMPTISGCGTSGEIGGKLYVTTACNGVAGYRSFMHMYDPGLNTWTARANSPIPHSDGAAGTIGGLYYLAGGWDGTTARTNLDIYNPGSNTWSTAVSSMPTARYGQAAAVLGGKLFVLGGYDGANYLSTVEAYDPAVGTWLCYPGMATPRSKPFVGVVGSTIIVAGGGTTGGGMTLSVEAIQNPKPLAPAASLFNSSATASTSILWTWTAVCGDMAAQVINAATASVSGVLAADTTSWLETGLTPNTSYARRVAHSNESGASTSSYSTRWTLAAAPSALAASAVYVTSASLNWSGSGNAPGTLYSLDRTTGTGFLLLSSGTATAYTDTTLTLASTASYRVRAFNAEGLGTVYSSSLTVVTFPPPSPSGAGAPVPTVLGSSSITWTWSLSTDATSYFLYRPSDLNVLGAVAAPPAVRTGLTPNTAYGLRVAGKNFSGLGALSASATAYTEAAPPSGTAASVSSVAASVSWGLNGNPGGTPAELQRSTDAATWTSLSTATASSYLDYGLLGCTTYYYRVRHRNALGSATAFDAAASTRTSATVPSPASSLTAESLAGGKVKLDWAASPTEGILHYTLYYDSGTGTVNYAAPLGVFTSTETTATTGVLPSTAAYSFALRAQHRCGLNASLFASAGAAPTLPPVRTAIKNPDAGKRVKGNRLTVSAELISGTIPEVSKVQFQYKASAASAWLNLTAANANHPNPDLDFPWFVHVDADALGPGSYDLRAVAYDSANAPDPAPPAITVTVVVADAEVEEGLDAGKVKKQQVVSNAVTTTLRASGGETDDPSVTVILPAGAVTDSTTTLSIVANPVLATPAPGGTTLVGAAVSLTLSNGQSNLNAASQLTLTYPETVSFPDLLSIYWLDQANNRWVREFNSTVDKQKRTITGSTSHYSIFAVIAGTAFSADISGVRVYPNPYRPNSPNSDEGKPFRPSDQTSGIIFDRLPAGASIKIYTLSGRQVAAFGGPAASGAVRWDARNEDGREAASGAYMAVISAPGVKAIVKKVVIIR